jgi:hypothetical protein
LVDRVGLGLGHLVPAHVAARQADEQHWCPGEMPFPLNAMKTLGYRVSHA